MPIVSSTYEAGATQTDGRVWVHEVHTDQLGVEHTRDWLAEAGADLEAALAEHAAQQGTALHDGEIAANVLAVKTLGANAVLSFEHSTLAESVAAFRAGFAQSTPPEALMTAAFLASRTDDVLSPWMTPQQIAALRSLPSLEAQAHAIGAVVTGA